MDFEAKIGEVADELFEATLRHDWDAYHKASAKGTRLKAQFLKEAAESTSTEGIARAAALCQILESLTNDIERIRREELMATLAAPGGKAL